MAPKTHGLVLTRSDQGDGGWSLHPAGTSDEQIAEGLVEPLLTGEAVMVGGRWDRPNQADYDTAAALQEARRKMRVWALWYGGSSYAPPRIPDDLEEFSSVEDAGRVLQARATSDPRYPCVSFEATEMQVFFRDPTGARDPYPDLILRLGPEGEVRVELC